MSRSGGDARRGRVGMLGRLRAAAGSRLRDLLYRPLSFDGGRSAARRALRDGPSGRGAAPAAAGGGGRAALRSDVVFVTARFRSGSTLLWNLFRSAPGFTAYYEPFNERRWFDPATRGSHTDPTHRGVDDYWREYEGLEDLARWWHPSWHDRRLFLPAGARQPDMKRFIETMIGRAPGRPVLQFNRIDLRLPWVRGEFPNATIVHLHRHPRDQWCSALLDPAGFRPTDPPEAFARHDHFYLRVWQRDLRHAFPFLDERAGEHPYRAFYYVWKLSRLFGERYADHSLSFESLVEEPAATLARMDEVLGLPAPGLAGEAALVTPARIGRWREWADDDWFREHEEACERTLEEFLAAG